MAESCLCVMVRGLEDETFQEGTPFFSFFQKCFKDIEESDPDTPFDVRMNLGKRYILHCECSLNKDAVQGDPPTWKLYQRNKKTGKVRDISCNSEHMPSETFHEFIARNLPGQVRCE